jgi:hypothetical protein
MNEDPGKDERELQRLRSEVDAQHRDIDDKDDRELRQETLIDSMDRLLRTNGAGSEGLT